MTDRLAEFSALQRANIPPDQRGAVVWVEFLEPILNSELSHFYRVQISEVNLQKGENDRGEESFFRPEITQPYRTKTRACGTCGVIMRKKSEIWQVCENRRCPKCEIDVYAGPVRGVVRVVTGTDSVVGYERDIIRDKKTGQIVSEIILQRVKNCVLVLDRRYPDYVLEDVFRLVKRLAETNGWKVKG